MLGTTGKKELLPLQKRHFWWKVVEHSTESLDTQDLGANEAETCSRDLFFFPGQLENWNFLLSSGQADKVEVTWPNLRCLFTYSDMYKWAARLVQVLTLSRKCTMQQGELAGLVLLSETSFPEGKVCKAPAAVHPLIFTRTTPRAGGYYSMGSTVGFLFFF